MENLARMAMASNRRIVQEHLDRRKIEKQLNTFEDEMIQRVNDNRYNAILQRDCDTALLMEREGSKLRILSRVACRAVREQIRKDTALGCLTYFAYAVVMLWLTRWTYLPVYAAVTCIVGGVLFLAVYLCRVHGLLPVEDAK